MNRVSFLSVLAIAGLASAAAAQQGKPVARADYIKTVDTRFNAIDTNHDGKVSRDEMVAAQMHDLQAAKGALDKKLQEAFTRLDTNHDGKLSLAEFMASEPPLKTAQTPDQILQQLDTNHDGKISPDEFRAPELAKFNKVDANHDGIVTPAELQAANRR